MFHTYNWSSLTLRNVIPVHSAESGTIIDTFGSQKYYQLAIKFNGKTFFQYNGQEHMFASNDVVYIPKESRPDIPYRRKIIEQGDGVCIFFDSPTPLSDRMCVFHCGDAVKHKFALLNKLFSKFVGANGIDHMQAFYDLLGLLRDELDQKCDRMNEVERYIQDHFCDAYIDIGKLAKIEGVSDGYFRQKFKKQYSVSPLKYINNLKIEYAKTLICQNRLSIAEVSSTVGFADANYFSRFFKKYTGLSPTEYEKKYAENFLF